LKRIEKHATRLAVKDSQGQYTYENLSKSS